jgi:guanylate kinase
VIVVISGPGGVGKGSVVERLLELEPGWRLSRSWTTRPRRPGEPQDAYVFTDRDAFVRRIGDNRFLEWTEFEGTGHLYGTPTLEPDSHSSSDPPIILEIELDGAQQVKSIHPDAVLILIVAPSRDVQAARLRGRGDEEAAIARRLEVGEAEELLGRRLTEHVVVNDEVERAAREVAGIMRGHQAGR